MKLKPLNDRVVATPVEAETKTASGLLLPDQAKEATQLATVTRVGKAVVDIKPGDTVIYDEYSPRRFKHEGVGYLIMKEEDVIAVLEQ